MSGDIRLTQYSHGAGCGCKISPQVLEKIVASQLKPAVFDGLIVGHETRDDAAVFDLGDGSAVVSTTDFFMPIVDDPITFGRIAATNAISDVYAMGGTPIMAIAILGWPINLIGPDVAQQVVEGGRMACREAGIALAGGHSIDSPEPIFGLAVTGRVNLEHLKTNTGARAGDVLLLTKPLGVGILSTAQKKGLLADEHANIAPGSMCRLNSIGSALGQMAAVTAMTDVTGFGLLGHLLELCDGGQVSATIRPTELPVIPEALHYLELGCVPGGTGRNFDSYGQRVETLTPEEQAVLCDPQTSGGLLVAVDPGGLTDVLECLHKNGVFAEPFGVLRPRDDGPVVSLVKA